MSYPKIIRFFFSFFSFLFLSLFLVSCGDKDKPKIGVIQTSDHEALSATRLGMLEELRTHGFSPEQTIQFKWESAQGNPALAAQIAQKFVGQKYDVLVGIGTLASQAALKAAEGSGIPVVYSSVTDPKGAKLEGNITGVSNFVDPKKQFSYFQKILPTLKKIGVIFSAGEQNSVALNKLMDEAAQPMGLTILYANAPKTVDVHDAAMSLVGKVDALFVNNDNIALAAFDAVLKVGRDHNIPVFVSDTDLVSKGALAAIGASQTRIGLSTGRMVADLLSLPKNERDASKIPPVGPDLLLTYISQAVAKTLHIDLDETLLREATRIF